MNNQHTHNMTHTHLVIKSGNAKTGPIPVSTTESKTCPDSCPFKAGGCYASGGPLAMHWRKVSSGENAIAWGAFCAKVAELPDGQLWRHNQAGDLPGEGNAIDRRELRQLVKANRGKRGFTYTHKPLSVDNACAIADANAQGFTVNLSANSPSHADSLADFTVAGRSVGPVVCVLPSNQTSNCYTPKGRKIVVCPATVRDGISCATCGLCQKASRSVIVGFPAHGVQTKKASAIASN